MDIRIIQERNEENSKREVYIFNPTSKEFSITNKGKKLTVSPSAELKLFYPLAELFVRKIVDYMVNKKDKLISDSDREELAKRVRLYDKDPIS